MKNNKPTKLLFRQNGFIIGFTQYDWDFLIYVLMRGMQFFFDMLLPNIFMLILWKIYGLNIMMSTMFALLTFVGFNLIGIAIFGTQTIGMAIGKMSLVDKNGIISKKQTLFYRTIFSTIYILPVIGWLLIIPTIISIIISKGISPIDLFTKSQILPNFKAKYFHKIVSNLKGEIYEV